MAKRKIELLERRILALETQVSIQNKTIHSLSFKSSLSGFLTGLNSWQRFLMEAERQFNLTVPVNPFPSPPPPQNDKCWDKYQQELKEAGSEAKKRLDAVEDYHACISD